MHKKSREKLERLFHGTIPITGSMGVRVIGYDGSRLRLSADFDKNKNIHGSGFAGSLYSLSVLAGWGLLFLRLDEEDLPAKLVVREGTIKYNAEVIGRMEAECSLSEEDFARFLAGLKRGRSARIQLTSTIDCNQSTAVIFSGNYVAKPDSN